MKRKILYFFFLLCGSATAQDIRSTYEDSYLELKSMIDGMQKVNFKRAVFITENAYLENALSYTKYENHIKYLASLCTQISKQSPVIYSGPDYDVVNKYGAVFRLMTDSIKFQIDSANYLMTVPFTYDFDDFLGDKNWKKMFVSKLLTTHTGNCHSLPFLYKILCEELDAKAYLAMAPNHIYIKQWAAKSGWFNTELTSKYFPIDAWIMASGYISLPAVQNRIYMDTLSQKQSIAVCLIDLAKGFERKFPDDIDFIEKCANIALKVYPNYVNAMILKAEVTKKRFEKRMIKAGVKYATEIFNDPESKSLFEEMEAQYLSIHESGYRMMPTEMYISWLAELKREKAKYVNKEIMSNLNSPKK